MKKFVLVSLILLVSGISFASEQDTFLTNVTAHGWRVSPTVELKQGREASLKNIFCSFANTAGTNIRVQVRVGTKINGTLTWGITTDFTIVELAGVWTLTRLGEAVGTTVNNPFWLVSSSLANAVQIRYNITTGTITKILMETSL